MTTHTFRLDADAAFQRGIRALSVRGPQGNEMLPHRSLARLELPAGRIVQGAVLAVTLTLGLLALRDALAAGWGAVLVGWMHALGLPGRFEATPHGGESWFGIALPLVEMAPRAQHELAPLAHLAVPAALWWLCGRLPDAMRPAAYLLRLGALIHAVSAVYFAVWEDAFPHSLAGHVGGGLAQAWALMLITPSIHLFTYYLFPFALRQHLALTVATLAWLAMVAPTLYALHAALLQHLGLVVMPLLQLLFGPMVLIAGFVALYGWAMSWSDQGASAGSVPAATAPRG